MPDRDELHDRIAGALALSALGDAMGLPHEARGLRGEVCEHADTLDPFDLPITDTFRDAQPNPWNIWAPTELTAGRRGVVSDDTAVRLTLIEPWVADVLASGQAPDQLHEFDWLDWLTRRRTAEPRPWCEAMVREHATQWPTMYADADGLRPTRDASPCFFRRRVPVCFGYFLFGELALHFADRPNVELFDRFAGFCRLDQGPATTLAGVVATLIAHAGIVANEPFDAFWTRTVAELHAAGRIDDSLRHDVFDRPRRLGETSRTLGLADFLHRVEHELYDHPTVAPTHDLKPFDATLQLAQLRAYVAYANDQPATALRLTALGPGDTDTLGATLGLILGARLGHAALQTGPLADALHTVEATTTALFSITSAQRALRLSPVGLGHH